MNFYPHFSHLLSDLHEILYTRSERDAVQNYEFSENRNSENHTLLKGANEILSTKSAVCKFRENRTENAVFYRRA